MAQISRMLKLLVETNLFLCKIVKRCSKDLVEIRMHNPAVRRRHNIIETSSLVHSKRKRSILVLVTE